MKTIRSIINVLAGLVFIFSGFVKAIDPLGSSYKFHDYFTAFHLDFLSVLSLPLALLMCTAEFMAGFLVLSGLRRKAGIWGIFLLILFFTPLTLVMALTNPVKDCGCFGDAIHLTNWQTFGKNIILLGLILILFIERNKTIAILKPVYEWIIAAFVAVLFILFSLFNLKYLPIIDFLPYSLGTNIASEMMIPEGAQADQYSTTFIYEKAGVRKEFTINDYPANDTSWKFIEQKSVLVKKGFIPPIHDFSVTNLNNEDITNQVLSEKGYTLLMVSKKLDQADTLKLRKGFGLGADVIARGMRFYLLSATGTDELKRTNTGLPFCITDETVLKSMVRSNPGYLLLYNGTIVGKWSWANVPDKAWFKGDITGKELALLSKHNEAFLSLVSFLLLSIFIMILCKLLLKQLN